MNFVYCFGFFLVNITLITVGILQCRLIVIIVKYGSKLCSIYRGNTLMRCWILNIFNTVTAENQRPVCFSIRIILIENLFIDPHRFIKFVVATKMVCSIVHIRTLIIIELGQRLLCATVFAGGYGFIIVNFKCATAHFTFKECHYLSPPKVILNLKLHSGQTTLESSSACHSKYESSSLQLGQTTS